MYLKTEVNDMFDEMVTLRRDFHTHPELGLKEVRTSAIIEDYLKNLGLEVRRCANTGVIGVLKCKNPGKTIMLRCDIDALPVTEETDLPFKSQNEGVMHACGHDGHTAMLLTTAKLLNKHKDELNGTVVFLFQTNEEDAGAELMINDGALENPRPDAVCGLHLWSPIESGKIGIAYGPIMASSYYFKITIHGKGGHGGAPHTAINPIDTAGHILGAIKTLHTLEFDSTKPTVISVCKIHGGSKEIVVPDTVEMEGSIRCLHEDDALVHERFKELVNSVCSAFRTTCEIELKCGNTLLNNDTNMTNIAIEAAKKIVGEENIKTDGVSVMLGDDFSEFSKRIPGVYYFVGTANEKEKSTFEHHNPKFNIDEETLKIGVLMYTQMVFDYLNHK